MIVYEIENCIGVTICIRYKPESVYDALADMYDVSVEDAIDASSWCELACVGEVYQGENFRIRVEEE